MGLFDAIGSIFGLGGALEIDIISWPPLDITHWPRLSISDIGDNNERDISPLRIAKVQNIAPIAAHIKEVNHIDPLSIEALHVSEIRNIDPVKVERFNVTDLPMVNMSLRQLPPVNMNLRRLPPVSIGTHQDFHVPSNYTVRARLLGIEFLRIHLNGQTRIAPKERFRREQARTLNRSFPVPATAGNPAIPSIRRETKVEQLPSADSCCAGSMHKPQHTHPPGRKDAFHGKSAHVGAGAQPGTAQLKKSASMYFGTPRTGFSIPRRSVTDTSVTSNVSSGG